MDSPLTAVRLAAERIDHACKHYGVELSLVFANGVRHVQLVGQAGIKSSSLRQCVCDAIYRDIGILQDAMRGVARGRHAGGSPDQLDRGASVGLGAGVQVVIRDPNDGLLYTASGKATRFERFFDNEGVATTEMTLEFEGAGVDWEPYAVPADMRHPVPDPLPPDVRSRARVFLDPNPDDKA